MIKVYPDTRVYVYAPIDHTTGGAELLHQLVDCLNRHNIDSYIVYFCKDGVKKGNIPKEYSKYLLKVTDIINDSERNIVVIYEGIFNKVYNTKKTQKILWWLSVDNFYLCSATFLSIGDLLKWNIRLGVEQLAKRIVKKIIGRPLPPVISWKILKRLDALHCYQSEYAHNLLEKKDISEILPLSDFINSDFLDDHIENEREKKVLYNPKKGYKYTKKLIKHAPHIKWIPLIGMTREELLKEFRTAMLYIDFGYHPGKDRIPREAALNGCCVITNVAGSAKYFEDVSIPGKYKINEKKISFKNVLRKIEYVFDNYNKINNDFEFYRYKIKREKDIFEQQTKDIFQIK